MLINMVRERKKMKKMLGGDNTYSLVNIVNFIIGRRVYYKKIKEKKAFF